MVVTNIKSERKGKPETLILDGDEACGTFQKYNNTYSLFSSNLSCIFDQRIVMNFGRRLEGKEKFVVQLRVARMILFPPGKRTC